MNTDEDSRIIVPAGDGRKDITMLSDELLEQVKVLDEQAKLRLVQILIDDLKLVSSAYEIYTPFGNDAAARVMQQLLKTEGVENQPEIK